MDEPVDVTGHRITCPPEIINSNTSSECNVLDSAETFKLRTNFASCSCSVDFGTFRKQSLRVGAEKVKKGFSTSRES